MSRQGTAPRSARPVGSRHHWVRRAHLIGLVLGLGGSALSGGCRAAIDPAVIADAQISVRIKTELVNDPLVGETPIDVRVQRGVAYLTGRVRSQAAAARAVELARAVPGVADVKSTLEIGDRPPATPEPDAERRVPERARETDASERATRRSLFGVGAAVGWSFPRSSSLHTSAAFSPLIKIGPPRGLGPVLAFEWFGADVESGGSNRRTPVRVRPIMVGAGYTLTSDRLSFTPSLAAGYAFNSLSLDEAGDADGLPIDVANSLVWRIGASGWYDLGRRMALHASGGYVMTGLRFTFLDGSRLESRKVPGDSAIVHMGIVYTVF